MKKIGIALLIFLLLTGCKPNTKNGNNTGVSLGTSKLVCTMKMEDSEVEEVIELSGDYVKAITSTVIMDVEPEYADAMLEVMKQSYVSTEDVEGLVWDFSLNSTKTKMLISMRVDIDDANMGKISGLTGASSLTKENLSISIYRKAMEDNGYTCH